MPPVTGEMTQLAAIFAIASQFTTSHPAAAMPAPITPPTIEWVVETGAPNHVAALSQIAAPASAPIMTHTNTCGSGTSAGSMMPFLTVLTTSPPAMIAWTISGATPKVG